VVVRAPHAPADVEPLDRRAHAPTLPGLGFRIPFDTIPGPAEAANEAEPVSHVRTRVAPRGSAPTLHAEEPAGATIPSRLRPTVLLEDVDDALAKQYLEEARKLLESGIFSNDD
jgi:hypothetical protein